MKTTTTCAALLALLFAGCGALPQARTTTDEERTWGNLALNQIVKGVAIQELTGKVSPENAARAHRQIAEIRALLAESETRPIAWVEVFDRITTIALEWAVDLPPQDDQQ